MKNDNRHRPISPLPKYLQILVFLVCRELLLLPALALGGSFSWVRLGSGPLHPGGLYLGWGQGPTPNTAFGDRMGSSPPPGVEPVSMTIGPQGPYQVTYLIPS
ncbi:hypothetical protein HID58_056416, partial [Brassica napus]